MSGKIAIYELAKELGLSNKELLEKAKTIGIEPKSHLSRVEPTEASRIRSLVEREKKGESLGDRSATAVIRRRVVRSVEPALVDVLSDEKTVEPSVLKQKEDSEAIQTDNFLQKSSFEQEQENLLADKLQYKEEIQEQIAPVLEDVAEEVSDLEQSILPPEFVTTENNEPETIKTVDDWNGEDRQPTTDSVTLPVTESVSQVVQEPNLVHSDAVVSAKKNQYAGLGPTGRVIDLTAWKNKNTADAGKNTGVRGPRQEITGDRIRQERSTPSRVNQGRSGKNTETFVIPQKKEQKTTQITVAAEHKRVVKLNEETITIKELASRMSLKATDLLKKIWEMGTRSVMINSPIDLETAQLLALEFGWKVESVAFQESNIVQESTDAKENMQVRAPVITIMGHVDHGKTSLLDAIRNANVASGESGGITQHIGAYRVKSAAGYVVFLDTPGHEAFTEMRARGAQATDIVVLVVAADDGVMPQTLEALNHAKDANVPIVVAVNKIDKSGAQPDRIRQQLSSHGLTPEEWGGQTIYVDVSARTKQGIDKLLEMLALQSEVMELQANPNKPAKGIIIEARMDAKRGPVSTLLVQEGTLKQGDYVVAGEEMGRIRAMFDDKAQQQLNAGPSTPVEILGLSGVPKAGELLHAVADEKSARVLAEHRRQRRIEKERARIAPLSLDKFIDSMKAGVKELKLIIKADVQGSVEAMALAVAKLSTQEVKVSVVQSGVGGITETDVNLAKAGNAIIIGFRVRPTSKAASLSEQEGVEIKLYEVIYDALDDIQKALLGLLGPVVKERSLGRAEVRQLFSVSKVGTIAGCMVVEGSIKRSSEVRLLRDLVPVYKGKLASLKRGKDDAREVEKGYECGILIDGYNDVKVGDIIESYVIEEVERTS